MALLARCSLAVLVGFGLANPARADGAADAVTQWGLLGTWSPDCKAPPSMTNTYFTVVIRDGRAFEDREFGKQRDSNEIEAASVNADGTLDRRMTFAFVHQTRVNTMTRLGPDVIRTISNVNIATNEYSVRDGRFSNGSETPRLYRCDGPPKS